MVILFHPAARAAGNAAAVLATLREALPGDRAALAVMAAAAFAQGPAALMPARLRARADAGRFAALFAAHGPLLLAEAEGRPLGCILAEPAQPGEPARITGLWVAPGAAGQGIGSALLAAMERHLAAAGAESLRVRVPSGHLRALGLFRRRGYAMQAAGQRTEPVLQVPLPHTVLAKPLAGATAGGTLPCAAA
ncbi:GNAT family N-acetyltransferase [Teichococcus aestuarii]|uniref:N-acetyltransferase domain-containing protein n=1 Tax=Teichococcus aestuarii TaxID=568898 RepID=A0A2U1V6E4_9PROT|nr:GNAT family N-acetyltransferase [Pseudoroseomonas aestuarii]PWC29480.1 hypothetical protein CR165_05885 [Pseudoroseomonas aestuarii]